MDTKSTSSRLDTTNYSAVPSAYLYNGGVESVVMVENGKKEVPTAVNGGA